MTPTPGSTTFAEFGKQIKLTRKVVEFCAFSLPAITSELTEFCNEPPEQDDPEAEYQKYFVAQVLTHKLGGPLLKVVDTHLNSYLDGRKPDVSFFAPEKDSSTVSQFNVVIATEIKTRKTLANIETDASTGEMATWAHRILRCQPLREFCFTFITDCENILFLKTVLVADGYKYFMTPSYKLEGTGTKFLQTLLSAPLDSLGFNRPIFEVDNRAYHVKSLLGEGLTSSVWSDGTVAIKQYKPKYYDIQQNEVAILETLATLNSPNLPKLVDKGNRFIVMSPLGTSFLPITRRSVKAVLNILKQAHEVGIVHRDLRLSNIIKVGDEIVLIDWGFASEHSKQPVSFRGNIHCAAPDVLEANLDTYVPYPKHDLHTFARAIYVETLKDSPGDTLDRLQIAEFWDKAFVEGAWKKIAEAAELCDYASLASLLGDFCPNK